MQVQCLVWVKHTVTYCVEATYSSCNIKNGAQKNCASMEPRPQKIVVNLVPQGHNSFECHCTVNAMYCGCHVTM